MFIRSERIVTASGIIKAILNIEDDRIIEIINYHARVMIDYDFNDLLVIPSISQLLALSNSPEDINNYLIDNLNRPVEISSFCDFLEEKNRYFAVICDDSVLSENLFKLINQVKENSFDYLIPYYKHADSISVIQSIKYLTEQMKLPLADSVKICCENVAKAYNNQAFGSIDIDKKADLWIINDEFDLLYTIENGLINS
ncbi:MAG: amidohydrolase family protein [Erysipelotrichaceae bacterium]